MYQQEQAARGIALLNEKKPDWATNYYPATLDMATEHACVLGQVFGSAAVGMSVLGLSHEELESHGFIIPLAETRAMGLKKGELVSPFTHPIFFSLYRQLTGTWLALTGGEK